ncbi:LysE family translocator [Pseudovibrio exalbescens]|uniref:LysE family translocator n=1 Tax=Pseudovibrio exalbescens TaxID=197461 RepID=UPI000C9BA635|nr:LysE family translocator [Pseudovibrio exalbescens]
MELQVWLAFVAASIVLVAIPGPSIMLTMSYALSQGRRVAIATAAGVAVGDLVAMTTSLAGLGALVMASAELFTLLKWLGAIYLVFLGFKLIRTAPTTNVGVMPTPERKSERSVFFHALLVTAFNPKSIAFFIAFVPQFIDPQLPLFPQFALLVATFVTLGGVNALMYALVADQLRKRITRPSVLTWFTRTGGGAMIAMGLATAAMKR